MKDQILTELRKVKRPGIESFINYLEKETDFFKAPASSEFHLSIPGGLAQHSWNVYQALTPIAKKYVPDVKEESIILSGLLHDLCKTNFYKNDFKNKKNDAGVWEKVPYYSIDDKDPFGHGEKSVILINRYMSLEKDEALAIRWHMGAWDAEGYMSRKCLNSALDKCKLLKALMLADQLSTFFMEDK